MMVLVTIIGLVMMTRYGGLGGGPFGPFVIIWVVIGLAGAAMAFYNALSEEGLPLYEVDVENDEEDQEGGSFCPRCGERVAENDQFCRHCGERLS